MTNTSQTTTFPTQPPQSAPQGISPQSHGYPNGGGQNDATAWQQPHFFTKYSGSAQNSPDWNPHLRILMNEPDGTRIWHDPVTGTYSFEHASGYHHAVLNDGVIETVPGKKTVFIGSGGLSEAVGGHVDQAYAGHHRQNVAGDVYHNVNGTHHSFHGGGSVAISTGNVTREYGGDVRHRLVGTNPSFGIGVGPGSGGVHDSNITMNKDRIYIQSTTQGDIWAQTKSQHINIQSGKNLNVQAAENISMNAQGAYVIIKGDTLYFTGKVEVTGDLLVSGNIQMASANTPDIYVTNLHQTNIAPGGGTCAAGSGSAPDFMAPAPTALNSGTASQ